MNWKHLIWIIPICLLIGAFLFNFAFSWLFNFTMNAATEKAFDKLEECQVAWAESPLSDKRVLALDGQFCYSINETVSCPVRKHPMMEEYRLS